MGSPGTGAGSPQGGPRMEPGLEGLFALLGGMPMMGGPGGQMGDYVLDQHALDEIVTRLMEQNQGARPVPAPDDMIAKLPRTKITPGHPLTEKECAVCKDTFVPPAPGEEDVIAITLPCSDNPKFQHSFHEDCIVPWLKQNGTCPVCRHRLLCLLTRNNIEDTNSYRNRSRMVLHRNPLALTAAMAIVTQGVPARTIVAQVATAIRDQMQALAS
ncbi:hypothetical protein M407DRAFT_220081 [Tulasnella calospora MUT 4182]|uniref:RING-type domain-containing protein n=1 Tax=Tulasnella calospora MUT 4182 TaxID=1051891 RepID=A0A0C3PZ45_9AGAM|nr:hypothetical protein M407DRAFT_220081 [Tulasnella calospora MUT 4182]